MENSTAHRVIKNTGYLYAKMGITMFVSLYTTRLILNGLGAADFGIFNIVGGAIAMLGFLNAAMASATQRFMSYAEGEGNIEKKTTIFNVSICLHLLIATFVAIILTGAGFAFFNGILNIPEGRETAAIIVYGSLVLSTSLTIATVPYDAVLNSHENMKYYSIIGIVESLLKLLVAFYCVQTQQDKLIAYGILMACIPFVTLSVIRVYCHKHYKECKINFQKYYEHNVAKIIASFAGWNFLYTATSMTTMQGMSILLNVFGGVVVNAAHGIANQLSGQLMVFSNNMLKALNPTLVKSKAANQNNFMLEAASTGNKMSFIIFSFFTIPFITETPYILSLWLKEIPAWTVLFVRLVLIREMLIQTYITCETCILATGKVKGYMISSSIIWISPIVLGFVFYELGAPIYTIYILLILMSIIRGANALIHLKMFNGLCITSYLKETTLPCVGPALIILIVFSAITKIYNESFFRFTAIVLISFTSYPLLCYYLTFNLKERKHINEAFTNIRRKILR